MGRRISNDVASPFCISNQHLRPRTWKAKWSRTPPPSRPPNSINGSLLQMNKPSPNTIRVSTPKSPHPSTCTITILQDRPSRSPANHCLKSHCKTSKPARSTPLQQSHKRSEMLRKLLPRRTQVLAETAETKPVHDKAQATRVWMVEAVASTTTAFGEDIARSGYYWCYGWHCRWHHRSCSRWSVQE